MTELMVQAGVAPREKFTTIYSGMEVEPLSGVRASTATASAREFGYRPEHVVVGKVARLFRLKGHDDVIQAARRVVAAEPNVRFLFVGDGLLADRLRAANRRRGPDRPFPVHRPGAAGPRCRN